MTSQVFKAKEVMDNSITLTKTAMSGAVIDTDRLVIGTEEGLLCIDLDREGNDPAGIFCLLSISCFPSASLSHIAGEGGRRWSIRIEPGLKPS